jgi:hypothetical protein
MEKSGKRGKIPQSDWPLIMARYEQGETLSSIARTYDCSPPAISYIVSRSRGKTANETPAPPVAETQLIKAQTNGAHGDGSAPVEPTVAPAAVIPATLVRREPVPEPRLAMPTNDTTVSGDHHRTLHLSLGNGNGSAKANGNGNGNGAHSPTNGNGHALESAARPSFTAPRPPLPQAMNNGNGNGQRPSQMPRGSMPFDVAHGDRDPYDLPEARPSVQQPRDSEAGRRDNSAFIDQALRSRVNDDIAAFLAAFDAALAEDSHESRFGLREATDRLLRAGARTRIELERLEARVPLSSRDGGATEQVTAWRYR